MFRAQVAPNQAYSRLYYWMAAAVLTAAIVQEQLLSCDALLLWSCGPCELIPTNQLPKQQLTHE